MLHLNNVIILPFSCMSHTYTNVWCRGPGLNRRRLGLQLRPLMQLHRVERSPRLSYLGDLCMSRKEADELLSFLNWLKIEGRCKLLFLHCRKEWKEKGMYDKLARLAPHSLLHAIAFKRFVADCYSVMIQNTYQYVFVDEQAHLSWEDNRRGWTGRNLCLRHFWWGTGWSQVKEMGHGVTD